MYHKIHIDISKNNKGTVEVLFLNISSFSFILKFSKMLDLNGIQFNETVLVFDFTDFHFIWEFELLIEINKWFFEVRLLDKLVTLASF